MVRFRDILVVLVIFLCSTVRSQPFQIGHTTLTFVDSTRNNRSVVTEVYYPADSTGNDVALTLTVPDKFPVLGFGHGFVMTWDSYQNIWSAVVPEGFIIAFPKTEGTFSPSHTDFGKDIAFVISELNRLGQDNSSLFYHRVDTMNCIMGHSMGGGSSFLGAQFNPIVKTLATLAPAETNPSAIQAALSLHIPSLIIAGENDCVTPPPSNQIPMYDSLQSLCKSIITIKGASHCQMADNNTLCSFGETTCTPQPAITRADQHTIINRYLIPWLKYELKGDCAAGFVFDSLETTDTSIVFEKNCFLCSNVLTEDHKGRNEIKIFPNPFGNVLHLSFNDRYKDAELGIYLLDGRRIFSDKISGSSGNQSWEVNTGKLISSGIFILELNFDGERILKKIIKE